MKDSSKHPRESGPGRFRRELLRENWNENKEGPPAPPKREGPELRKPDGGLERALVKRYKNGGCVMAGRGVRDTKFG
jgi:hypothetical protein